MSSFHKNHGPMISGGCGSTFQLTITNPTGSPSAKTARYHGLACGYSAASASASATEPTNRSCSGATRSAMTASRFTSVISPRVTATAVRLAAHSQPRLQPPGTVGAQRRIEKHSRAHCAAMNTSRTWRRSPVGDRCRCWCRCDPEFADAVPRVHASLVTDSLAIQLGLDEAGVKLVEGPAGAHGQRGRDPRRLPG